METDAPLKQGHSAWVWQKIRTHYPALLGVILGIGGGYLYYYFIGCSSGSCPLTSNPWMSMLWGGLMGFLLGDTFLSKTKKSKHNENKYGLDG